MTIDFHTHVFPDAIAKRTVDFLAAEIDNLYEPVSDGSVAGLLANMDRHGVNISVNMPVVTKQSQFKSTNDWAAALCDNTNGRVISFGGIYPRTDDYKRDIDYIKSLGLKGLKFHAEYQDFITDAPEMLKIYDYALSKDLILLHHGGADPAFKPPFKSSPAMFKRVYDAMQGGVIVAAHLGGHNMWDEVESTLAGTGVYIDTSMGFEYFGKEQFLCIVKKHGADKILFASDAPWSDAGKELEHLAACGLDENELAAIKGGNAARALKLRVERGEFL